ncbi:MAG: hypothetical protein MZV70_39940 [Desulfobacterales bacterium]|nr:hypothetical protein [Desulfobacterales bacterium]
MRRATRPEGRSTSRTSARTTRPRCGAGARTSSRNCPRCGALGYPDALHPDVGVLPLLLRGRVPRAPARRRADAARQARQPARGAGGGPGAEPSVTDNRLHGFPEGG